MIQTDVQVGGLLVLLLTRTEFNEDVSWAYALRTNIWWCYEKTRGNMSPRLSVLAITTKRMMVSPGINWQLIKMILLDGDEIEPETYINKSSKEAAVIHPLAENQLDEYNIRQGSKISYLVINVGWKVYLDYLCDRVRNFSLNVYVSKATFLHGPGSDLTNANICGFEHDTPLIQKTTVSYRIWMIQLPSPTRSSQCAWGNVVLLICVTVSLLATKYNISAHHKCTEC